MIECVTWRPQGSPGDDGFSGDHLHSNIGMNNVSKNVFPRSGEHGKTLPDMHTTS